MQFEPDLQHVVDFIIIHLSALEVFMLYKQQFILWLHATVEYSWSFDSEQKSLGCWIISIVTWNNSRISLLLYWPAVA